MEISWNFVSRKKWEPWSCSIGSDCPKLYLAVYSQPENIMLLKPESKKIKLIDFGLSRKLREDEIVKEMMGTPEFVGESNTALVHASMCSVTTNTRLQWADFFREITDSTVKTFGYNEQPPKMIQPRSVVTRKCAFFIAQLNKTCFCYRQIQSIVDFI